MLNERVSQTLYKTKFLIEVGLNSTPMIQIRELIKDERNWTVSQSQILPEVHRPPLVSSHIQEDVPYGKAAGYSLWLHMIALLKKQTTNLFTTDITTDFSVNDHFFCIVQYNSLIQNTALGYFFEVPSQFTLQLCCRSVHVSLTFPLFTSAKTASFMLLYGMC